jgi:hypothetical protein
MMLTSKTMFYIAVVAAVFSGFITVRDKRIFAVKTSALIVCLSFYQLCMLVPPCVSTRIRAETFNFSSFVLFDWF